MEFRNEMTEEKKLTKQAYSNYNYESESVVRFEAPAAGREWVGRDWLEL